MCNAYSLEVDDVLDMDLMELPRVLTRREKSGPLSVVGSVALFIGYLILAIPIGAAFLFMVILSLPIWALTKDEVTGT